MSHLSGREISSVCRALNTAAVTSAVVFRRAQGCWVESMEGERYLDLIAGYGVANTGWSHPRIVERIREQAGRAVFAPPMLPTLEAAELSHVLLEVMAAPEEWRCVRATGGADANEQVLKGVGLLAERAGRPRPYSVLRFEGAYHGGTDAMLALSDVGRHGLPRPLGRAEHPCLPAPSSAADVRLVGEVLDADASIAAVLIEPVIGSGGVHPFPLEYLRRLRAVCSERGVPLVFDEVMTGCGRVGALLAAHLAGIMPDAVTLGKGLSGGGAAIGAALVGPELGAVIRMGEDTTSTFAWSPMACVVAMENLRIIEDESLHARAALLGPRIRDGVEEVLSRAFGERATVRGVGMMIGAEIGGGDGEGASAVRRLVLRCRRAGLLVGASWDWRTLVLLPPLVMTEQEAGEALARLEEAVRTMRVN